MKESNKKAIGVKNDSENKNQTKTIWEDKSGRKSLSNIEMHKATMKSEEEMPMDASNDISLRRIVNLGYMKD